MKKLFILLLFPLHSFSQTDTQSDDPRAYVNNQVEWMKRYADTRFESNRQYTEAEMKAVRDAVNKVELVNNQKFEAQNEWRQQMKDQTSTYVTRTELWTAVVLIIGAVASVVAIFSKMKSKTT